MKYANLRQIPYRPRLVLAGLYLTGLGVIFTGITIAILDGFTAGYTIGMVIELIILAHLLKWSG